jgi:hypothetical protein
MILSTTHQLLPQTPYKGYAAAKLQIRIRELLTSNLLFLLRFYVIFLKYWDRTSIMPRPFSPELFPTDQL